jgi:hypothetical protein
MVTPANVFSDSPAIKILDFKILDIEILDIEIFEFKNL